MVVLLPEMAEEMVMVVEATIKNLVLPTSEASVNLAHLVDIAMTAILQMVGAVNMVEEEIIRTGIEEGEEMVL